MRKIKVATVFSGIGAIEWAMKRMKIDHEIVFACDNGERDIEFNIDQEKKHIKSLTSINDKHEYVEELYKTKTRKSNYVKQTYMHNYPQLPENRFFQDIMLLDGTDFKDQVDLFVGGSPCQSFSQIGYQAGLDDPRGNLFYEYARLVKEIQPKVFIYENVRHMLNHDNGKTWKKIKETFDSLNYTLSTPEILNSMDYGIPQNRKRLFIVGYKKANVDNFIWPPRKKELKYEMRDFLLDKCDYNFFTFNDNGELNIIDKPGIVDEKYTLSPKLYAYVMKGGTKTFYQKPVINKTIARTILKTMGNRHRAGIDNYISIEKGSEELGNVRMLTEREALRLMGFTDEFEQVVSRAQLYKQAGNSIVVDVLMSILESILEANLFSL